MSKASSQVANSSTVEKPTREEMKAIRAVEDDDLSFLDLPQKRNRFFTKFKENPFVPIGCLATVFALSYGLVQFKRGNQERSQLAMRLRVVAQGGTVVALVVGGIMAGTTTRKKPAVKPTEGNLQTMGEQQTVEDKKK